MVNPIKAMDSCPCITNRTDLLPRRQKNKLKPPLKKRQLLKRLRRKLRKRPRSQSQQLELNRKRQRRHRKIHLAVAVMRRQLIS